MRNPIDDIFDQISRERHRVWFFKRQFRELTGFSIEPAKILLDKPEFETGQSLSELYENAIKLPVDLFTSEELDQIVPFLENIRTLI